MSKPHDFKGYDWDFHQELDALANEFPGECLAVRDGKLRLVTTPYGGGPYMPHRLRRGR